MRTGKDYILRLLAFGAYLFAFYFSWLSSEISNESPELLAFVWGFASLIYWGIAYTFEVRDRKWIEDNKD